MNNNEKELELAKLMDWDVLTLNDNADWYILRNVDLLSHDSEYPLFEPYSSSPDGLAQFAAILLKFPEIIDYKVDVTSIATGKDMGTASAWEFNTFNQENILDQILVMKGIIDE